MPCPDEDGRTSGFHLLDEEGEQLYVIVERDVKIDPFAGCFVPESLLQQSRLGFLMNERTRQTFAFSAKAMSVMESLRMQRDRQI